MKEKKTAVITFRTEEWVKDLLQEVANENQWSIAQTVNELCKKFVANPNPNTITIKTNELSKIVKELEEEGKETATELTIELEADEEKNELYKTLNFQVLQCGGHACCFDFDNIKELSQEELLEIP